MPKPARAATPAAAALADNRRRHERFHCLPRPSVRFVRRLSFRPAQAYLVDVSAGGVGLLVGRRVEPGTILLLQLPGPPEASFQPRLACVVNIRPYVGGGWILGCELDAPLDEEELATVRQSCDDPS
jgi:PilZ domain-containing protein